MNVEASDRPPHRLEHRMTASMTCKHCNLTIDADDEDELVDRVQTHVLGHDRPHELTREHIASRRRRQTPDAFRTGNLNDH